MEREQLEYRTSSIVTNKEEAEEVDDLKVFMNKMEKKEKKKRAKEGSTLEERIWVTTILAIVMIVAFLRLTGQQHQIMSEYLRFQRSYRTLRKEIYEICTGFKYDGIGQAEIDEVRDDLLLKEQGGNQRKGEKEYHEFLNRLEFQQQQQQQDLKKSNLTTSSLMDKNEHEQGRMEELVELLGQEYYKISTLNDLLLSQEKSLVNVPKYFSNTASDSSIFSREEFLTFLNSASITTHQQHHSDDPRRSTLIIENNLKLLYLEHIKSYFNNEIDKYFDILSKASGPVGRLVLQKQTLEAIQAGLSSASVHGVLREDIRTLTSIVENYLKENEKNTVELVNFIKSKYDQLKAKFEESEWPVTPLYEINRPIEVKESENSAAASEYNDWNTILREFYSFYLNTRN